MFGSCGDPGSIRILFLIFSLFYVYFFIIMHIFAVFSAFLLIFHLNFMK